MSWIDVSVAIRDGMVHWPDNPPIVVEKTMDMAQGAVANVSKIAFGVHTATHMDAPCHFKAGPQRSINCRSRRGSDPRA